ncbi:MAG: hypothetical protein PWQ88_52 [Candidatus Methanomethylophilaceae archaeon]|nr:hypothetical protein [Candidatus Methanomethylophilaceae archaeon]MDI3541807.1 hypothetical protein [Candidatus Methanomethylophilaceae archaeon]HIJ00808.1 hypothetical protein [Candidatus Methanomethylophilaceae archaeon]
MLSLSQSHEKGVEWWEKIIWFILILPLLYMALESVPIWFETDNFFGGPALTGILSVVLFLFPVYLRIAGKVMIPRILIILIYFSLFLHAFGLFASLYDRYSWWDKIAHLISSVTVATLSFITISLISHYVDAVNIPFVMVPFMIIMLSCFFGVIWEILEWTFDRALGTAMQYGLEDTIMDLIVDLIGGVAVAVGGYRYLCHNSLDELAMSLNLEDLMQVLAERWDRRAGSFRSADLRR